MPSHVSRVLLAPSFVLFLLPASIVPQQTGTSNDTTAEVVSRAESADTTRAAAGLSEGGPLLGVPAHMLNTRLTRQLSPSVEARLGGQYRSSRHRPDSFHEPHLGGGAQGATSQVGDFQAYTLVDLGASWRMNERLTMNATVENLLDRNFVDYRPYSLRNDPEVTAFSNVYNNILEPRRLSLTLRAAF
jgi:outer membrane receptor for ferrienterochelin and colicins